MLSLLQKYKAFLFGFIIFRMLVFVLSYFDIIYIDNSEVLANSLSFIFGWVAISLPIHYFSFIKQNKAVSLKLIVLMLLFFGVMVNDNHAKILGNPITFMGLIGVGLGFLWSFTPKFFKKYAAVMTVFYAVVLSYFYYIRVYTNDINTYLQQEKELKIILIAPFLLVFFSWMYEQWKWLQQLKAGKAQAELALLRTQINPHFFFNTLNNLYGLTVEKSDDAPEVVLKLSEMMRYTIYMGKEDVVPLKEEINYLKNYIALHQIRYQKTVDIVFNSSLETNHNVAPLLYIIPLENAFKHGVEGLTEGAYIHMSLKTDAATIYFEIENNFEVAKIAKPIGIGLENLKQRLQLVYPDKHHLKIETKNYRYKLTLKIEMR